ncbi:hypothetical protein BaRGS_00037540 [Batillaria attramentaria]|uniref:Uncharacterized protein n=1 Tax=Batillaria attramentaria TaxID=370345 RepID=A0ABD0J8J2_9CAEN
MCVNTESALPSPELVERSVQSQFRRTLAIVLLPALWPNTPRSDLEALHRQCHEVKIHLGQGHPGRVFGIISFVARAYQIDSLFMQEGQNETVSPVQSC